MYQLGLTFLRDYLLFYDYAIHFHCSVAYGHAAINGRKPSGICCEGTVISTFEDDPVTYVKNKVFIKAHGPNLQGITYVGCVIGALDQGIVATCNLHSP